MARLLFRIGRGSYRHKWLVVLVWLAILAAVAGSAGVLQKGFTNNFAIPGTASEKALDLLMENFPEEKNPLEDAGVNVVFQAPRGHTLDEPQYSAAIDDVVDYIEHNLPDLTNTIRFGNPVVLNPKLQDMVITQSVEAGLPEETALADAANLSLISPDRTIGYTAFSIDVPTPEDVNDIHREVIHHAMDLGRAKGLVVEAGSAGFGEPLVIKSTSEVIGLGVAFLVLIFTFGSLVAAGLPLLTAVIGIGIGSTTIVLCTRFADLNETTPVLAVMLGLAVGIDYALFILSRYRAEYKERTREEAAGVAVGTAGSAVVFAGLTVVIALVALSIVNIPFLTYMGLAAAFTVTVAVLIAITLVPALLAILGRYAFAGRLRKKPVYPVVPKDSWGTKWVKFVHKYPALVLSVVVLGLGALTLPVGHLELALPSDNQSEKGTTQRASADLLTQGFGAGFNAPFLIVVDAHDAHDGAALEPLTRLGATPAEASFLYAVGQFSTNVDVAHVQIIGQSADGLAAQLLLSPKSGPDDPATTELLAELRGQEKVIEQATGVKIGITGLTPIQQDVTTKLADAMPLYLGLVVGLAIVLLLIIFRSIMVPIVAGLGFLLSVGAAFGTTVLFWQDGLWNLVATPGPLISFMPIFLIGVTFGLAMDYQVFLVTRMREQYVHGTTPLPGYNAMETSVIEGFALGAKVVTSAALIMIAVFVAFIDQTLPFIKIFGFALGAGVLFDAFFVRMALIPASMFLLGRATWWMPKWLDKILPHFDVEGQALG